MRKIYSFLNGMSAVKSLFLSLLCLWTASSTFGQATVSGGGTYPTIQAAVNAAPDGGTITVAPGTYNETDIFIEKSLTILGPWANTSPNDPGGSLSPVVRGAEAVIKPLPGTPAPPSPPAPPGGSSTYHAAFIVKNTIGNSPINVTIKGFTFQGGSPLQDGHSGYDPARPLANIVFENNIISHGQLIYGGYYWGDVQITNNNFNNDNSFPGDVGLADAVYLLGGNNVNVSNNVIKTAYVGILVKGSVTKGSNAEIADVKILNNIISTTTEEGIQIGEFIKNGLVSKNEINGAVSVGGIRIYMPQISGRVDVNYNIVKNTPAGVNFTAGNANQELYVNYNSLDLTNTKSIINNGTGALKATCNWLGTADCAGIEGRVSGNVVFSPFLQNGVDDAPNTIGFQTSAPCTICCTLAATLLSKADVKCFGGSDGTASFNITGGTGSYTITYTLNGGPATPSSNPASGLVAGSYIFTVKDNANNCTATVPVTIGQPTAAISPSAVVTDVKCYGGSTGSIDLTVTGGTGPYTYAWTKSGSAVSTSEDPTGLTSGTYTVVVTDANKCTATKDFTVNQPAAALGTSATTGNATCAGKNGSIDLTVTGGTSPYTFSWTVTGNPAVISTSEDLTGVATGSYTVTVTDKNLCTTQNTFTVGTSNSTITLNAVVTDVKCYGGSTGSIDLTVTGGTASHSFAWTKAGSAVVISTAEDPTGLTSGTYTVVVTDANKCTATKDFTVTQPAAALVVTASNQQNIDCDHATGSVTIGATGGTPNYTGTGTFTGLSVGDHTYVVTDANGCSSSVKVTITKTDCPACTLKANISNQTNVTCFGGKDGSITITATGGTPPYTGTGTFSGLKEGYYSYDVTDAKGCKVSVSFYIDEPDELKVTFTQVNVSCQGASDGSVKFTMTGGTSPYVIKNVTTGANNLSNPVTGLKAGTYSFLITDKNGCCKTVSVTITEPTTPCVTACTFDKDNKYYGGFEAGKASISAGTAGSDLYYGLPRNGSYEIVKSVDELGGGGYLNITPHSGQYFLASHTSNDASDRVWYSKVTVVPGTTYNFCAYVQLLKNLGGGAEYILGVYANGVSIGTGRVNFGWSQICGTYTVPAGVTSIEFSIRDPKKGLFFVAIDDICLTKTTPPVCKVTVKTVDVPYCLCTTSKGSATLSFTGKAPFKYTITPGNISGTSTDNTETISLSDGDYNVKVTDASGCVSNAMFFINQTDPITGSIGVKLNTTFPGQQPRTIYIGYTTQYATLSAENIQGGTPPYTYKWYPTTGLATPNDDETKATPTCTTTYTLMVTDSKGCKFYKSVTIKVVDVRCGKYNTQVEICCKGKTLCVDKTLVSGYLATGSTLGACGCDLDGGDHSSGYTMGSGDGDAIEGLTPTMPYSNATLGLYPNPTGGVFRVSVPAMNVPVQIVIADAKGNPLTTTSRINTTTAGQTFDFNLSTQPAGMYLVRIVQGQLRSTYKLFIIR